jgi:hypothetical protein
MSTTLNLKKYEDIEAPKVLKAVFNSKQQCRRILENFDSYSNYLTKATNYIRQGKHTPYFDYYHPSHTDLIKPFFVVEIDLFDNTRIDKEIESNKYIKQYMDSCLTIKEIINKYKASKQSITIEDTTKIAIAQCKHLIKLLEKLDMAKQASYSMSITTRKILIHAIINTEDTTKEFIEYMKKYKKWTIKSTDTLESILLLDLSVYKNGCADLSSLFSGTSDINDILVPIEGGINNFLNELAKGELEWPDYVSTFKGRTDDLAPLIVKHDITILPHEEKNTLNQYYTSIGKPDFIDDNSFKSYVNECKEKLDLIKKEYNFISSMMTQYAADINDLTKTIDELHDMKKREELDRRLEYNLALKLMCNIIPFVKTSDLDMIEHLIKTRKA